MPMVRAQISWLFDLNWLSLLEVWADNMIEQQGIAEERGTRNF